VTVIAIVVQRCVADTNVMRTGRQRRWYVPSILGPPHRPRNLADSCRIRTSSRAAGPAVQGRVRRPVPIAGTGNISV